MTVTASWNGKVIAKSDKTVVVENNHYFPRADVDEMMLVASDTTSHCPWKGDASYYTITANGEQNADAAWYYPDPKDAASEIKDHIAFWKGVEVSEG
ncbi:DUF427 domain-containing protein [Aurantiacibacter gangjinensis]|uniref:DUF427 domain-containing protein n=1 Tax=Aurantiacibacter gangjinensis TaxID=502682 RepID=A0A0G9MMU6_9SPHN|nr:DUF427 domain-containing protein [Aurantiacibacter gangjinensis]APE28002.1 hypothetical protein BMF35_a1173 [Aurantiacibacter gangjinensis]KLE31939.1 hypothetical protein AAW01_10880 [Aurantiacibacter gangjinensis]